ncbi:MAG: response regulator [Bdellovibrionales bacterium]|nr:response regulator [Bdellovibrionales bacterium]
MIKYGGATVVTAILIDDSLTIQKLLERLTAGKATIAGRAKDGFMGFELFKQTRPDIVFLDITMPNCGGKECLRMILEFDRNARVVMVSSLGDQATMQECLEIGALAFLKKEELTTGDPQSKQKLHTLIEQLVRPQESRAA